MTCTVNQLPDPNSFGLPGYLTIISDGVLSIEENSPSGQHPPWEQKFAVHNGDSLNLPMVPELPLDRKI
jgi:hypothetical protein